MDCRPNPAVPRLEIRRQLVSAFTVADVLGISVERVDELIDTGALRWAFNIACKSSRRRLVRVFTESLVDHQAKAATRRAETEDEFPHVMSAVFPTVVCKPGIVAKAQAHYIAQQLSVTSDHVFHLIGEGALRLIFGTKCRRGPGGSPEVAFASVTAFLQERRII